MSTVGWLRYVETQSIPCQVCVISMSLVYFRVDQNLRVVMASGWQGLNTLPISWFSRIRNAIQTIRKRTNYLFWGNYRTFQDRTITLAHPDEPHKQKYGKFGENSVSLTRTCVENAAPKTHSHSSDRLSCEARKNAKKGNWRRTQALW